MIWREIPGWEGLYEVSETGLVRSLSRTVATWRGMRGVKGKELRAVPRSDGYFIVVLSGNGQRRVMPVHHLVLLAFVGPPPSGFDGCHNNGVRGDNHLQNLRWDTRRGNMADKADHGTLLFGQRAYQSKLTKADVLAIRQSDKPTAELARDYGVTWATLKAARSRKTWRHVT